MKTKKIRVTRTGRRLIWLALVILAVAVSSCNVTRRTTTESSFYQRGDTTVQIVTKTIESYDATKKVINN